MTKTTQNKESKTWIESWQTQALAVVAFLSIGFTVGKYYSYTEHKIEILELKQLHHQEITKITNDQRDCKILDQEKQIESLLRFVNKIEDQTTATKNGRK